MSPNVIIPFVHRGLGNSSYLVRVGEHEAVLVDPDRSVGRYLEEAATRGWRIVAAFETHLHADFVTGSVELQAIVDVLPHVPDGAKAAFEHRAVRPGDLISIGEVTFQAIGSPGHTPEHLSYLLIDDPPVLFSGGSLIVGGAARTDLIAPELTEPLTRALFRSIREAFTELPDETRLLPTHGGGSFCSTGSSDHRSSTIGAERRSNPLLQPWTEDSFAEWFPTTFPPVPAYFPRMRSLNSAGPRVSREIARPPLLDATAFHQSVKQGALVVDVRSAADYAAGHVLGSLSIPFRDVFATWLGWLAPEDAELLFVLDGIPLERVVEEAMLVGFERFAGVLDGGLDAWRGQGLDVASVDFVAPDGVAKRLAAGALALDVRERSEVWDGGITGAVHVPLGELPDRAGELEGRSLIAYCGHGERASTAASVLERAGIRAVANLDGGISAWREAMQPERERR